MRLFRSEDPKYADGGQLRDFVWVGDCVRIALWALEEPGAPSGLYNVGSGTARSFLDKAKIMFEEMGAEPYVKFVDLPANLRGKYQYYTCASMDKAREASFAARPASRMAYGFTFAIILTPPILIAEIESLLNAKRRILTRTAILRPYPCDT